MAQKNTARIFSGVTILRKLPVREGKIVLARLIWYITARPFHVCPGFHNTAAVGFCKAIFGEATSYCSVCLMYRDST